ncbi:MAG TPA: YihY/virulence factor BrkB family protein [Dehalococcoidia bacterium]|nr:YihY/virulence factor BrkB family protein [Dehalococcoidia bacterium]
MRFWREATGKRQKLAQLKGQVQKRVAPVAKKVSEDDIGGLAAEMTYRFFLALFPFLIFATALSGFISDAIGVEDPSRQVVDDIGDRLPADAASVLEKQLDQILESRNIGLLSFGAIASLWSASSAMNAVIKAMNRIHNVQRQRPLWRRYLLALGMTLLAATSLITATLLLIIGASFGNEIAEALGLGGTGVILLRIARWAAAVSFVMIAVAFIYWATPAKRMRLAWITPGSVLFTAAWFITSMALAFYVANFASYNVSYGSLGGVIVLLLWLYLTNYILLLGAEVNAISGSRFSYFLEKKAPELLHSATS